MPWSIRPATPADAAVIIEFNRRLAEESEGKVLPPDVLKAGVEATLTDPHKGRYFVAEEADQVCGQMMVTYEWSDWRNGWFWWIQSVYVRAEARRRGVFRALFEYVTDVARQDGNVIGLRLYVEKDNSVAQRTYHEVGMNAPGYFLFEKYPL